MDVESIKTLYMDQRKLPSGGARDDVTVEGLLARWDKLSITDNALLAAD